ncbi:MAG: flagellar protein FliS [Nitrospinae bacterium]|nr:flagellar protein FliS [Nitrospinota bacterium]
MPKIFIDGKEHTASASPAPATVGELLAEIVMVLADSQKVIQEVSIDGIALTEASLLEISQCETAAVGTVALTTMTYEELARFGLEQADLSLPEMIREVIRRAEESVESFRFHPQEYARAIEFVREAERRMRAGDGAKAREYQALAFAIISDLMAALDYPDGGEIAANVHRLYAFMLRHLSEGSARQDPQNFEDVAWLLTVLHDAFSQAVALVARTDAPAPWEAAAGAR